eukprot:CAMPEP_0113328150 /NCGR_PEP_ID=MMETSP0010_2-20120614/19820_1 /TAXON_ID=216773 ORGANISM="Corethron hystrix, Strain 308" /NCGR_SAMPLE_ID=MMETSP0010_2 /ASSEMBLY_ACC=CAM_ASM_000155 /LENGTH=99 /DNA_ID=CAMNT_0000189367 /DNA_START=23 /DNA_END=319 /DNA_ORIENTATION=+ /assembly_acc=CAM_ASM_000155
MALVAAISAILVLDKATAVDVNETCDDDNNSVPGREKTIFGTEKDVPGPEISGVSKSGPGIENPVPDSGRVSATRSGEVGTCGMYLAESSVAGSGFGLY